MHVHEHRRVEATIAGSSRRNVATATSESALDSTRDLVAVLRFGCGSTALAVTARRQSVEDFL